MVRAADAPTQLVQLRQAEAVGTVDQDGVGCGDVYAGLDDGRTEQHVVALLQEFAHDALELAFAQLPVGDCNACLRQQALELVAHHLYAVHFVMQEIHLAAAL